MNDLEKIEKFIEIVGTALRTSPVKDGFSIFFPLNSSNFTKDDIQVSEERLNEVFKEFSSIHVIDDTSIISGFKYEVLVSDESKASRSRFINGDGINLRDEENKITYTLSKPSDVYLMFLLFKLSEIAPIGSFVDLFFLRHKINRSDENEEEFDKDVFNALRLIFPRLRTLRIETEQHKQVEEYKKYVNSFIFQLSYNIDIPIVPQSYLDEFVRWRRITKIIRSSKKELEAPKKIYIPEIIYHYQLAVASDSPSLQYLSYYHVLEYFYEAVFNDDLIQKVVKRITLPDFSTKRKKDVKKLINEIAKSLKFRGENTIFSESEALKLVLEKYVNLDELIKKFDEYDKTQINYFLENHVEFSNGDAFDLLNEDSGKVYQQISSRIYKTRNAIVHSKENEKIHYIPFEHDKILVKEIPLLRFIAELVIIETSSLIP